MKVLIPIIFLAASQFCHAQDGEREYFNAWGGNTSLDSANYYTEWTKTDTGYLRTAYFLSNAKIKFTETFKKNVREGKCTYYHQNGNLQEEVNYYNNHPIGLVKSFYPDGSIQIEKMYDSVKRNNRINEKQLNYRLINFYDSTGKWLTKDGFGFAYEYEIGRSGVKKGHGKIRNGLKDSTWVSHFSNGQLYYTEVWDKGRLLEGKSFSANGTEYSYQVLEEMAEPANGMSSFYNYVGRAMRYPKEARVTGIEGRVFAEFIVEKDGSLSKIKIVRGIGSGCDEEAARVIDASPNWKPGLQRGQPVRTKFGLPIIFKLE